ncbi:hypothetical protein ACFLVO_01720 [Chloroflexota bacterium]
MIIECPECGTKNSTDKPPQPGKKYRCGKCGATITFLQASDTQDTLAQIPKEKAQAEKQEEGRKTKEEKTKKQVGIGCAVIVIIAVIGILISSLIPGEKIEDSSSAAIQLTSAEQAYATTIGNHAHRVADTMDNLTKLFSDFQIGDDTWTIQVAAQLVTIQMLYDEVLEIDPPSSMAHIHNKYVQAMKHYETATNLIPQGIDRLDTDLINQATAEILTGGQLVDEATSLLEIFLEERYK